MGKMIYVAKKYVVEYANTCCSNYKNEEFKDFLEELQPNNGWIIIGDEYSNEFEVSKKHFKRCIKVLELIVNADKKRSFSKKLIEALNKATMEDDGVCYFDENDKADYDSYVENITGLANSAGFDTLESALEQLKSFYKVCDKKCAYLHFCSF